MLILILYYCIFLRHCICAMYQFSVIQNSFDTLCAHNMWSPLVRTKTVTDSNEGERSVGDPLALAVAAGVDVEGREGESSSLAIGIGDSNKPGSVERRRGYGGSSTALVGARSLARARKPASSKKRRTSAVRRRRRPAQKKKKRARKTTAKRRKKTQRRTIAKSRRAQTKKRVSTKRPALLQGTIF
jgi:hypothetical protein